MSKLIDIIMGCYIIAIVTMVTLSVLYAFLTFEEFSWSRFFIFVVLFSIPIGLLLSQIFLQRKRIKELEALING